MMRGGGWGQVRRPPIQGQATSGQVRVEQASPGLRILGFKGEWVVIK
eukprot:CAMPEP_0175917484 /NCGR_PEP_ID=MMETSP0108-20121206/11386_1 /TAXON_ID=195067 ORGANISM="Goniomonas pacifica, Strain CCMP1869" /NCGR_SAMPLE_ID=MMETSP0108 /ASSEMBLY_ACC=CAM_ASM_000204 /LENGTH=46 /DNA_ID= /DNA_START= /DNA_END= /DNA_ORIENTATION=